MRYEYKYIVHAKHLNVLRKMINPFLELDAFAEAGGSNHYTVRSIYFDTPAFDFYFEKIEGIKNRKKIRLRGYDEFSEKNTVFLEIKRKYDVPIIKYRAPIQFKDAISIFSEKKLNGYMQQRFQNIKGYQNSKRFFFQVFSKNLRPVVLVVYEREAYHSKFDSSVRVTLDKNLRGLAYPSLDHLFDEKGLQSALNNYFIMEVKFNNRFPSYLNPAIGKLGLRKQSASKYVITMDSSRVVRKFSKSTIYVRSKWYN